MQSGVVDGVDAATYGFYEQKRFEVAKHLSLTWHVYTPSFLLASNTFMQSLNDQRRKTFIEADKAITDQAYEVSAALEAKYFEEMKELLAINEVDITALPKTTDSSYDDYVKSQGNEYLEIVRASAAK